MLQSETEGWVPVMQNCGYRAVPYREQTWMWRGYRVNYAVAGKGIPIVIVHGFGSNVHHFRKLTADLCEQYTGEFSVYTWNWKALSTVSTGWK